MSSSYAFTAEPETPRITPAVQWLIAINVAIYFLQLALFGDANMWRWLAFTWSDLDHAPWTMLTYMFVHGGFWHLAFNMYGLWLFGRRVEQIWSPGRFTFFYVLCGVGGVLAYLLFVRGNVSLGGASAAVLGVTLAYAVHWPDDEVLFFGIVPMKVKWMVALFIAMDVIQGMMSTPGAGGVAYLAHLGGLATGWLYLRWPSAHGFERLRQRISPLPDVNEDETPRAIPRSLPRTTRETPLSEADEVVAKSKAAMSSTKRPPAPSREVAVQEPQATALDLVLDKISEQGIDSLTLEERTLLEEMSRKLRKD